MIWPICRHSAGSTSILPAITVGKYRPPSVQINFDRSAPGHKTSPPPLSVLQIPNRVFSSVSAMVDLFNAPTLRGVDDDAAPLQEVSLPAATVRLSITLPRFSESGRYKVMVSKDRAGSQIVAREPLKNSAVHSLRG